MTLSHDPPGNHKTALATSADASLNGTDAHDHERNLDFGAAWTYAPAPEARDHVKIAPRYELFIGGEWRAPRSGRYFDTISPSREEKLSEVADADAADVADAVDAARHAYEKYWRPMRGAERAKHIFRVAR